VPGRFRVVTKRWANPAREIERYVISLVRLTVGGRGVVVDCSDGPDPDFRIEYDDERTAIGEITWHEDPGTRQMWVELHKREPVQRITLEDGLGQWGVSVHTSARLDRLFPAVPDLISRLVMANRLEVQIQPTWPTDELAKEIRRLGIEDIGRYSDREPSLAIISPRTEAERISDHPNLITDWLERLVFDQAYVDLTGKLRDHDADERHIVVVTGSATPLAVDEHLRALDRRLPTRSPSVPGWITHAWVLSSRTSGKMAGVWTRSHGWSAMPLPEGPP
jgi:hypothetical protein